MNYTVTISISRLLAPQKTLKFRISVGPSEVLVRPSDLCPEVGPHLLLAALTESGHLPWKLQVPGLS